MPHKMEESDYGFPPRAHATPAGRDTAGTGPPHIPHIHPTEGRGDGAFPAGESTADGHAHSQHDDSYGSPAPEDGDDAHGAERCRGGEHQDGRRRNIAGAGADPPDLQVDDAEDADDADDEVAAVTRALYSPASIYSHAASYSPTVRPQLRIGWVPMGDNFTVNSSLRSIYEGDVDYVEENGRRYCKDYYMPNDEEEQDRLRIMHQVFLNVFNLELTTVPLHDPEAILDVGTGTGEWAIGMSERYPRCDVVGIDISPIQSTSVPHNCNFEVDDAELEWERPDDSIDLVHLRDLAGAFRDWGFVYRQAFKCLKPGGWVEVLDFHDHTSPRNFYARFPPDSLMHELARDLDEASSRSGRRRGLGHLEPEVLIGAGFVDVQVTDYSIPLDPSTSPLGKLWLVACRAGLEAGTLRPLTRYMGWGADRVRQACQALGSQLIQLALRPETSRGFDVKLKVVVARKPLVPGQWTAQGISEFAEMRGYSTEDESTVGSTVGSG